ncbi:MAG: hypothetical protein NTNFB02_25940 [Nitrospira sp.]
MAGFWPGPAGAGTDRVASIEPAGGWVCRVEGGIGAWTEAIPDIRSTSGCLASLRGEEAGVEDVVGETPAWIPVCASRDRPDAMTRMCSAAGLRIKLWRFPST